MHKVVVTKAELRAYLEKGYALSSDPVSELLGSVYSLLSQEEREDCVLVEIAQSKHQAMNAPERAFCVHQRPQWMLCGAELLKLDVLERNPSRTLCASAEDDAGPRWFRSIDLGEDARQAVSLARPFIMEGIAEHRRIADELESFLIGMEAL
jgi:hypothetical protein